MQTTNNEERKSASIPVRSPDCQSFLLEPSFLQSFLPLEKKLFFFLPCAEQSVCFGLPVGRGAAGEQQASAAAGGLGPGPGPGSRSDVGSSSLD